MFLFEHACRVAESKGARDFLVHREDAAVRVNPDTKNEQHPAHDGAHRIHDGVQDKDDPSDGPRDPAGGRFGVGDRIGLRQNFGENQHEERHEQRGKGDPRFLRRRA